MSALLQHEARMVRDFMSRAGICVRVSPCNGDAYEANGHYWQEPVSQFDGDDEILSTRHLIKFSLNDIEGRLQRGDNVVINNALYRIASRVSSDCMTQTFQLHAADCDAAMDAY